MNLKYIVSQYLRESADKIINDECGLDENELVELSQCILHIKVNKVQAADFLHISTRTLDRRIESGDLPPGHKEFGSNQLYWYKDELLSNE